MGSETMRNQKKRRKKSKFFFACGHLMPGRGYLSTVGRDRVLAAVLTANNGILGAAPTSPRRLFEPPTNIIPAAGWKETAKHLHRISLPTPALPAYN